MDLSYDWRAEPFDAWEKVPQATRDKVIAAGHEDWKRVFDRVLTFNRSWRPLRPVLIDRSRYDELGRVMDRLLGLVLETALRRASTAGELRKLLGTPAGLIEYLDDDELLGEHLLQSGRPDVLISGGIPKFVEFNIGSEVGCVWDTEGVSTRFLEMFRSHRLDSLVSVDAPPSPVDQRYRAIVDLLGLEPGSRLTMVLRTEGEYPGSDNIPAILKLLDPFIERGKAFGLDVDVAPVHWLSSDSQGRLTNEGRLVESVFRLFVCTDMPQNPGQAALKAAVASGRSRLFTSSAGWLLANKLLLAWLWDDLDLLSPDDQVLVRRHIPWSRVMTPELVEAATKQQAELVLKPADEYGGSGVLVGHECPVDEWRIGLAEAVAGNGSFLLQDYVRPDRLTMDFVHVETGEQLQAEVPYSVGQYTFGRQAAGCFLRVGSHVHGEVLNLKRAVHVTGPLLVD